MADERGDQPGHEPPFFLAGRYPWVRKSLGLMFVALGVFLIVSGGKGSSVWTAIVCCGFLASGVLLWTRYWVAGVWTFYCSNSLAWLVVGLSEHKTYLIVFGIVLIALIGLALVLAIAQLILRNRAASRQLPTQN